MKPAARPLANEGPQFAVGPRGFAEDRRLTASAKTVLWLLCEHTNKTGWAIRKQKTMAEQLGYSRKTIQVALQLLYSTGWLEIETGKEKGAASRYRVNRRPAERQPVLPELMPGPIDKAPPRRIQRRPAARVEVPEDFSAAAPGPSQGGTGCHLQGWQGVPPLRVAPGATSEGGTINDSLSTDVSERVRERARGEKGSGPERARQDEPPPRQLFGPRAVPRGGTEIPPDWAPSPADLAYAGELGLSPAETSFEARKFGNYWRQRAGPAALKADWSSAWAYWLDTRSERFGKGGGHGRSDPDGASKAERFRASFDRLAGRKNDPG